MTRNSTSTSAALSADVGSSMISTRASWASARAISIDLLLAEAQIADLRARVQRLVEALQQLRWPARAARDWSTMTPLAQALARHEHVVGDAEVGEEAELLVDDRDAAVDGVAGALEHHGLAVELECAGGRRLDPGEDLHERRLARAVLAEQRGDAAGDDLEVDAAQGVRGAEHLVDLPRAHDRGGGDAHAAVSSLTGVIVTTVGAERGEGAGEVDRSCPSSALGRCP